MFKSIIVLCLAALTVADHPDYCEDKYGCTDEHIGCNNQFWDGGYGDNCGTNTTVLDLTPADKKAFLKAFNNHRNQQALGYTPGYLGATRMGKMKWDDEMAMLTELQVRQCRLDSDDCHNTVQYQNSGQTMAVFPETEPDSKNASFYATKAVDIWFEQADKNGERHGYMDMINHYHRSDPNYPINDFLQVVRDESNAVGCAILTYVTSFDDGDVTTIFVTCNYARGLPARGGTVYVAGNSTSDCESGTSTSFPGLCSIHEVYSDWQSSESS